MADSVNAGTGGHYYTTDPDRSFADLEPEGCSSVFKRKPGVSTLRISTYRDPDVAEKVVDLLNSLRSYEIAINPFTGEVEN
jgi:hypothetical protein